MTSPLKILLIGRTSFLAQSFATLFPSIVAISHQSPELETLIAQHDTIINCAFHPDLRSGTYDEAKDFDLLLARKLSPSQRLVLLSTRAVYGPATAEVFSENSQLNPQTHYGRNKAIIEAKCLDLLGERALVLRLSNIFGFEWPAPAGRKTFMSQLLTSLKESSTMQFDISGESKKDFLPVADCARLIHGLAEAKASGIINVAAGDSLSIQAVADAIKSGYGNCSISLPEAPIDSFYMDVSKLQTWGLHLPKVPEILGSFKNIGIRLAQA